MALLLPNLRKVLKFGRGIKDASTRQAVESLEAWAEELSTRLAKLTASTGVTLPIAESDVTNLTTDLAAKVPTTRTLTGTSPILIDGGASGSLAADRTISVLDNSTANRGTVAAAPNDTTKFYRGDATWAAVPLARAPNFMGSTTGQGPDGNITFDGAATVLGFVPAGNVYSITRDLLPHNMTVNNGVTLDMGNCAIWASGTLTNNGTIRNNGASASGTTPGAANTARRYPATAAGGTGATGGTASSQLPAGYATADSSANGGAAGVAGTAGAVRFRGGGGGGGGSGAGGNGGSIAITGNQPLGASIDELLRGKQLSNSATYWSWGSGGGGGGAALAADRGAGGAGGGFLAVSCYALAGSGTFSVNGGAGSNGGAGNGGGGGGGGGGFLVVIYSTRTGSASFTATGGAKGLGTGTGKDGGAGADGYVVLINVSGDGT